MCSQLQVMYPGNEIPKRFSYTSKYLTATRIERKPDFGGCSKFSFEIPLNLQERETLLGLALSFVLPLELKDDYLTVQIDILCGGCPYFDVSYVEALETDHVGLMLVDLKKKQGDICKVKSSDHVGHMHKNLRGAPLIPQRRSTASLVFGTNE